MESLKAQKACRNLQEDMTNSSIGTLPTDDQAATYAGTVLINFRPCMHIYKYIGQHLKENLFFPSMITINNMKFCHMAHNWTAANCHKFISPGPNMEPTWGWQDPCGPHFGPMNLALYVSIPPSSKVTLQCWCAMKWLTPVVTEILKISIVDTVSVSMMTSWHGMIHWWIPLTKD